MTTICRVALAALCLSFFARLPALAQVEYPNRPIRIVVGFTPGGGNAGGGMWGATGWNRLFTNEVGGQVSWLLPAAFAALASRLDAIEDGNGVSILDNTVIMYAAAMHGSDHHSDRLPVALIGGGGGTLPSNWIPTKAPSLWA